MHGLGNLAPNEMELVALVLECFCYGLYSALFFMYLQYQVSKELGIDKRDVVFYALCILYILSVVTVALDATRIMLGAYFVGLSLSSSRLLLSLHLVYASTTINGLCDFISQAILIYRCWVIWGHNIRVIIIPSVLVLIFLAPWLTNIGSIYITPADLQSDSWGPILSLTSLAMSLTVNAVVTGLIVLRILKLSRELVPTFGDRTLGIGGTEARVRSIIFIMIESGMAMFAIQSVRVVLTILSVDAFKLVIGINQMFNGITPTIILIRVSMGLSYHDEESISDIVGTLHFGKNSISDTEVVEIGGLDRIEQGDNTEIVDK